MATMARSQRNPGNTFVRWFLIRSCCVLGIIIWQSLIPVSTAMQIAEPGANGSDVTVRGLVLSTADQKPIADASVTLFAPFPSRMTTLTDDHGKFSFNGVRQGTQVNVSVKKSGFLCVGLIHTPWPDCNEDVTAKSDDVQLTMTLMPQAVITGRVVNQAGEPIKNLAVVVLPREIKDGRYVFDRLQGAIPRTDANGVFRIAGLEPGAYLVGTAATANVPIGHPPSGPGYQATWYPDSSTQDEAKPIVIAQGEQVQANLSVKESLALVNIPYTWNHPDREGTAGCSLSTRPWIDSIRAFPLWKVHMFQVYAPYGHYEFQCCIFPPGIQSSATPLTWSDGTTAPYCGFADFAITKTTISVPTVSLQQPISIPLHVRAELAQREQPGGMAGRNLVYDPCWAVFRLDGATHFNNELAWNPRKADTDLVFKAVLVGEHILHASGQGCYVASLTCGSVNLLRNPLVVGSGIPRCSIEAVVRDDFATIAVTPSPLSISRMTAADVKESEVSLIPLENTLQGPIRGAVAVGSHPSEVRVIPGKYLAFLFDGRSLAWRESDVHKHLIDLGKVFTARPGASQTLVLDWSQELNNPRVSYPPARVGGVGSSGS